MDENRKIDEQIRPGVRAITYTKNKVPINTRKKPKIRTRKLANNELFDKISKSKISNNFNTDDTFDKNSMLKTKKNMRIRKFNTQTTKTRKKTNNKISDKRELTNLEKIKLTHKEFEEPEPLDSVPLDENEEKICKNNYDNNMNKIKEKSDNYKLKNVADNIKRRKPLDNNETNKVINPKETENKINKINIYNEINQPITVQNTYIGNLIQNNLLPNNHPSQQPNYNRHNIPQVPLQTKNVNSNNDNIINNNTNNNQNSRLPLQENRNINQTINSNNYQKSLKSQNEQISSYYNRLRARKLLQNSNNFNIYNNSQIYNIFQPPQTLLNHRMNPNAPSAKLPTNSKMYNPFKVSIDPPENFNLKEFEVINLIGQGGFSYIFCVRWKQNGKNYALKRCISQRLEDLNMERQQAKILINFVNLTKCEGVVKIYGEIINKSNYTQYILMELVEGLDWEKEMSYRKNILKYYSEIELMKILSQLIKTCALLEKYNIAHRDLKPANVLITKDGIYKLCDFSDSIVCSKGKLKQLVRGTELFMSPLCINAYHNGVYAYHDCFKSDVFSLGFCVLLAATLDSKYLLEFRLLRDSNSRMGYLLRLLGNRFSMKFINLLFFMLQEDEMNRPYFEQLEKMVTGY